MKEDVEDMTIDSLFYPDFFEPFSCSNYSIDIWVKNFDPDIECYKLQNKMIERYNQNKMMIIPLILLKYLPILGNPENEGLLSYFIPMF